MLPMLLSISDNLDKSGLVTCSLLQLMCLMLTFYVPTAAIVRKYAWCLTSTETIRLIRDGEKRVGGGGMEVGGEGDYIHLSLHCHHQNDSCIKVGSDESHFNVS